MPTLIFEDKFETGGTWNGSNGTPTIVTSPVPPSATRALQINALDEYVFWNTPDSGFTRCVFGCWLRFPAFPTVNSTRVWKIDAGLMEGWMVINHPDGEPFIRGDGTPTMTSVFFGSNLALDTWYWAQLMMDVSANPWELRFNIGGTVISTTGAAAASNLDAGNFLLGNTNGEALTFYYGHAKAGVAANDNDWWETPTATVQGLMPRHGIGMGRW